MGGHGAFRRRAGAGRFLEGCGHPFTVDQGLELEMLGWCWLHALDENDYVALIKRDGTERAAFAVWRELASARRW
ncbi:MAG: hypothetical protein IBX68_10965 [Dehalococcoidia bacterium]|nr:hypothetical protein [Dehalococcoidia bacterium]